MKKKYLLFLPKPLTLSHKGESHSSICEHKTTNYIICLHELPFYYFLDLSST